MHFFYGLAKTALAVVFLITVALSAPVADSAIDHSHGHREDQIIPISLSVDTEGVTHTVRATHTHNRIPRDVEDRKPTSTHTPHAPGPVIHNPQDLDDLLFSDFEQPTANQGDTVPRVTGAVHTDFETRVVAYTTLEDGRVLYGASVTPVYHTHPENGPMPMVPAINPTMTKEVLIPRAIEIHQEPTNVAHHDGDGSWRYRDEFISRMQNQTTSTAGSNVTVNSSSANQIVSTIYDNFWNDNWTVTSAGPGTWTEVVPKTTEAPPPRPTGIPASPPITNYDPALNITWEGTIYEINGEFSAYWTPIATGEPTRAEDIAEASAWYAAGNKPPQLPGPELVFDSHTNTTWNRTVEGNVVQFTAIFVSVTTGPTPLFTHPPVSWLPEWPPWTRRT
ncbi:hypothetical protein ABW19_dt0210489 [Dactylella cylindrospora]|nr:hypothetical protein ABW19_dt0210489 [Dactylella cylindrospora]